MNAVLMSGERSGRGERERRAGRRGVSRTMRRFVAFLCVALLATVGPTAASAQDDAPITSDGFGFLEHLNDTTAPSAPTGVDYSFGDGSLTVRWGGSVDADSWVDRYEVTVGGEAQMVAADEVLEATFSVDPGSVTYRVVAVDAAENRSVALSRSVYVLSEVESVRDADRLGLVVAAYEAYAAEHGNFNIAGEPVDAHHGWARTGVLELIEGDYLDESLGDMRWDAVMGYRCGSGDDLFFGLSMASWHVATSDDDVARWDGCTNQASKYSHGYLQTTRTVGELAVIAADTTAPSRPGWSVDGYASASSSSVTMRWAPSTDNVGVTGYRVELYRGESVVVGAGERSHTLDLAPGRHLVRVYAQDAAGNESTSRGMWFRVQDAAAQAVAVADVEAIVTAIERFVSDPSRSFADLGGWDGTGRGWFDRSVSPYVSIGQTLVDADLLDMDMADIKYTQYMVYHCGSGDSQYAAVFAALASDSTVEPAGPNLWADNCPNAKTPFHYAHNYYKTTATIGELRSDATTVRNLTAEFAGGEVEVRWDPPESGAEDYRFQVFQGSVTPSTLVWGQDALTDTAGYFDWLAASTTYFFQVTARNSDGVLGSVQTTEYATAPAAPLPTATSTPIPTATSTPTPTSTPIPIPTATSTPQTILLSRIDAGHIRDTTTYDGPTMTTRLKPLVDYGVIAGYQIRFPDGSVVELAPLDASLEAEFVVDLTGYPYGETVTFFARPFDSWGGFGPETVLRATPTATPEAVQSLAIEYVPGYDSIGYLKATWSAPEGGAEKYYFEWFEGPAGSESLKQSNTQSTLSILGSLEYGVTYSVRVTALNGNSHSPPRSSMESVEPVATATPVPGVFFSRVDLEHATNSMVYEGSTMRTEFRSSSEEGETVGFRVTHPDGSLSELLSGGGEVEFVVDMTPFPYGETVYFITRPFDAAGNFGRETWISASPHDLTPPTAPLFGQNVSVGPTSVEFSVDRDSTDPERGVDFYEVYLDGQLTTQRVIPVHHETFTVAGLQAETQYEVTLRAVSRGAEETRLKSQPTTVVVATERAPDSTAPSAPGLTMISQLTSANSLTFNVTASTDYGGSGVAAYSVFVDGVWRRTLDSGESSFTIAGLAPAQQYQFEIMAIDNVGNRSVRNSLDAVTAAAPPVVEVPDTERPTAQTLRISNETSTAFTVGILPATDNVGVVGYEISLDGVVVETTAGFGAFRQDGLEPGRVYEVAVVAFDEAGNTSAPSRTTATTLVPPDNTPPTMPMAGRDRIVSDGGHSVQLFWLAAHDDVGLAGYRLSEDGDPEPNAPIYPPSRLSRIIHVESGAPYALHVVAVDGSGNESPALVLSGTAPSAIAAPSPDPVPTASPSDPEPTPVASTWVPGEIVLIEGSPIATERSVMIEWERIERPLQYQVAVNGDLSSEPGWVTKLELDASPGERFEVEITPLYGARGNGATFRTTVSALPDTTPPIAPRWKTSKVSSVIGGFTVKWYASPLIANSYRLYLDGRLVDEVAPDVDEYSFFNLDQGVSYEVELAAVDLAGNESRISQSASTMTNDPPSKPRNVRVTNRSQTGFTLSWDASTDPQFFIGHGGVARYEITIDGRLYETASDTTYVDISDLQPGTGYDVTITAIDVQGLASEPATRAGYDGMYTSAADDTEAPPPVQSISTWLIEEDALTVRWAWPTSFTSDFDHYLLVVDGSREHRIRPHSESQFKIEGLVAGQTVPVSISVVDTSGNRSAAVSLTETLLPLDLPPSAPGALTLYDSGPDFLTVQWATATDDRGIKEYVVILDGLVVGYKLAGTEHRFDGLQPNRTYSVQITPVDTAGQQGPPAQADLRTGQVVVVPSNDITGPSAPLFASALATENEATVSWSPSASSDVVGYYVSLNGVLQPLTTRLSSDSFRGLSSSTRYTFSVWAVDTSGNAGQVLNGSFTTLGNAVSAITTDSSIPPAPPVVERFTATPSTLLVEVGTTPANIVTDVEISETGKKGTGSSIIGVSQLQAGATYTVKVTNRAPSGKKSSPVSATITMPVAATPPSTQTVSVEPPAASGPVLLAYVDSGQASAVALDEFYWAECPSEVNLRQGFDNDPKWFRAEALFDAGGAFVKRGDQKIDFEWELRQPNGDPLSRQHRQGEVRDGFFAWLDNGPGPERMAVSGMHPWDPLPVALFMVAEDVGIARRCGQVTLRAMEAPASMRPMCAEIDSRTACITYLNGVDSHSWAFISDRLSPPGTDSLAADIAVASVCTGIGAIPIVGVGFSGGCAVVQTLQSHREEHEQFQIYTVSEVILNPAGSNPPVCLTEYRDPGIFTQPTLKATARSSGDLLTFEGLKSFNPLCTNTPVRYDESNYPSFATQEPWLAEPLTQYLKTELCPRASNRDMIWDLGWLYEPDRYLRPGRFLDSYMDVDCSQFGPLAYVVF